MVVMSRERKFGNIPGGNYLEIEWDGTPTLKGDATVWDDERTPVSATVEAGSVPPTWAQFKNDGAGGDGYALEFRDSNNETVRIPSNSALTFNVNGGAVDIPFSFGFLMRIPLGYSGGHVIAKQGNYWRLDLRSNGRLRFRTSSGVNFTTPSGTLTPGVIHCIVVNVDATQSGTDVDIYVDNMIVPVDSGSDGNKLQDANNPVYIASNNNSSHADCDIDELRFWDDILSESDRQSFYNNGSFTETSIATEICGYHFNEGSGTTADNFEGTAALDIDFTATSNDPDWITGFINTASRGVNLYFFDPDNAQELQFQVQTSHAKKVGSSLFAHIHFVVKNSGGVGEFPRFGIEYTWTGINQAFGNTITIYGNSVVGGDTSLTADKHYVMNLGEIDGSGITGVSSMLCGRIFRDASNVNDDYPDFVGLLEVDFHYEIDTLGGSREEFNK
jgi:hypothetical protein